MFCDTLDSLTIRCAVKWTRVDQYAQILPCLCPGCRVARLLTFGANHLANLDAKLASKLEVALVMSWYTHNRSSTIAHQHVVSNPNRYFLTIQRISDIAASEDARLILLGAHALDLGHTLCLFDILCHRSLLIGCRNLLDPRMFWSHYKESSTINRVGPRRKHRNGFLFAINLGAETNFRTLAAPNPVLLHRHGLFGPFDVIEVQQFLGILGDFQQPLINLFTNDDRSTTFARAICQHLLVCQRRVTAGTPVRGCFCAIGQPMLIKLQEQPLGPLIIIGQATDNLAVPIPACTHCPQLFTHRVNIAQRPIASLNATLDSCILCWQTKGIKAHWLHHVVATHCHKATVGINC